MDFRSDHRDIGAGCFDDIAKERDKFAIRPDGSISQ